MYGKKYGHESEGGYGDEKGHHGEKHGGYIKKSYIPVPYTINVSASMCRHECIPDIHTCTCTSMRGLRTKPDTKHIIVHVRILKLYE